MKKTSILKRAFLSSYYFTIGIKHKSDDILSITSFDLEYVIPATPMNWFADPHLVERDGRTWMFFEKVINGKGSIAVCEIMPDCTLSRPIVVFSDNYHYSYPHVYQINDTWYMIPETSDRHEIRLYKCSSFPDKWELDRILLSGRYVDTTTFFHQNQLYILTFELVSGSERVIPHIYKSEEKKLTELSWKEYNELQVRGAGKVFEIDGRSYRPVQISEEDRYGNSVVFVEMIINGDTYTERPIHQLEHSNIHRTKLSFFDGLHSYSSSNNYEVIDIRCRSFDWTRPIQYIGKKMMIKG